MNSDSDDLAENKSRKWVLEFLRRLSKCSKPTRDYMVDIEAMALLMINTNRFEIAHRLNRSIKWVDTLAEKAWSGEPIESFLTTRKGQPETYSPLYGTGMKIAARMLLSEPPPAGKKWTAKEFAKVVGTQRAGEKDVQPISEKQAWKLMRAALSGEISDNRIGREKRIITRELKTIRDALDGLEKP